MNWIKLNQLAISNSTDEFWNELRFATASADTLADLLRLSMIRKRASTHHALDRFMAQSKRIAFLGGITVFPLHEIVEHLFQMSGVQCETFIGDFNQHKHEILSDEIYGFHPDLAVLFPPEGECAYNGPFQASVKEQKQTAENHAAELLALCNLFNQRAKVDMVLCNYLPAPVNDLGEAGTRLPGSDWNYRRIINQALAFGAPDFLHICDVEYLAARFGITQCKDDRSWYESKQPYSSGMVVAVAKEVVHRILQIKKEPKKVLVTDLDNTLWGGVIGDDGMEGIQLGTTSAVGEAYRAFQQYIKKLSERGILVAVCSKNDHDTAMEPFRTHPEMVLKESDIVCFKANWQPKPENIKQIAAELSLGTDSFVFVDDNPAEIDIVKQWLPEVDCVHLGADPSEFIQRLAESRLFECASITYEDTQRTRQYRSEQERSQLQSAVGDYDQFLASLEMVATVSPITSIDLPRAAQLINKSNQFNLTTKRRSEAELQGFLGDKGRYGMTVRLQDRFGDHGLISVVLAESQGESLVIDTWVMSCRVLHRGVERLLLNEVAALAGQAQSRSVHGKYIPTPKNDLVREHYVKLGFTRGVESGASIGHELSLGGFTPLQHYIRIEKIEKSAP